MSFLSVFFLFLFCGPKYCCCVPWYRLSHSQGRDVQERPLCHDDSVQSGHQPCWRWWHSRRRRRREAGRPHPTGRGKGESPYLAQVCFCVQVFHLIFSGDKGETPYVVKKPQCTRYTGTQQRLCLQTCSVSILSQS